MSKQAESTEDAADTLAAYEAHLHAERERWKKAQPQKIVGSWKPEWTEHERRQHEEDVIRFNLPF